MNSNIQEKLHTAIANSKVFKLMTAEEQMRLARSLEQATDEQALQAIAALSEHERIYNDNEQRRLNAAKSQIAMAEKIHQQIRKSDQVMLEQSEQAEQSANLQKLQSMEEQINTIDQKKTKPKKFLGLF